MKRFILFLITKFLPTYHLKLKPVRKAGGVRKKKVVDEEKAFPEKPKTPTDPSLFVD